MAKRLGLPPPYEASLHVKVAQRRAAFRTPPRTHRIYILVVFLSLGYLLVIRLQSDHLFNDLPSTTYFLEKHENAQRECRALYQGLSQRESNRKSNPRWSTGNGQQGVVVLRNATLFDGGAVLSYPVDIIFERGLVTSISKSNQKLDVPGAAEYNLHGRWTTPGLVDMHSHHLAVSWPGNEVTDDSNEYDPKSKGITAINRIHDSLKPYDVATSLISSGGVTSSLLLPGSANLIGGEGIPVKNAVASGKNGEAVIDDYLLERGIDWQNRHRYMKLASGENPKSSWGYSRQGNAAHLRSHFQKAKDLKIKQDNYCARLSESQTWPSISKVQFIKENGELPFQIDLESTIGILRGQVAVHNHNYEPEDMETMLRIGKEFGFQVKAFHHALSAWQVPEMLKEFGDNLTIATFAEFGLFKQESSSPSLYASSILYEHGIPVAFKSDHCVGTLSAKYLMSQAAVGHAFHLPEAAALRSVTSVPAEALGLDYRIGYVSSGHDADIVVWDSHPLSTGATPVQVFIDGLPQLDQDRVQASIGECISEAPKQNQIQPQTRKVPGAQSRTDFCKRAIRNNLIITGLHKAFIDNYPEWTHLQETSDILTLIIDNGVITCFGSAAACAPQLSSIEAREPLHVSLENGYLTTGFTAVTRGLGMMELEMLKSTGDGDSKDQSLDDPSSIAYAKHGIWLDGKQFARARLGGVTRAVSPPIAQGLIQGVSTSVLTAGNRTILDGGIVQGDVALHLTLDETIQEFEGSISNAIRRIRQLLEGGQLKYNETVYGRVINGTLPLVVYAQNKYDIQQLIAIKNDFATINLVIFGGKEAALVAKDLAASKVPLILSENRPSPDAFRSKDAVVGPPLTRSTASYLSEAGVTYGLSTAENTFLASFRIHDLGPEAGWAAKFAHFSESEAVRLITTKIETILGLPPSRDLVIFEGSPLQYGSVAVLSLYNKDGKLTVETCYPEEQ